MEGYKSPRVGPSIKKAGNGFSHANKRKASKPSGAPIAQTAGSPVGNGPAHNYTKASKKKK